MKYKLNNNQRNWIVYEHISPSNKVYIGITHYDDPNIRWQNGLGYKKHPFFFPAILKYGWKNFIHNIIKTGLTCDEACELEKELIAKYKSEQRSYNAADGGYGHTGGFSDTHRQNLSAANRSHEPGVRAKISKTLKDSHPIPWNKGKTNIYSAETRYAMGSGLRGKTSNRKGVKTGPMSEETKLKLSIANKGKNTWSKGSVRGPYSDQHRKNISNGLKGKRRGISTGPRTEETKNKISSTRTGYKWICKVEQQPKQIPAPDVQAYLNEGWNLGKILYIEDIPYKWCKLTHSWVKK